nr:MAG TPA_asm: hypothetical protein [Caudoviricetes sp.]
MSKRFGRNQRRKMREKIYGLELRLYEIRLWMEENSLREKSIPKAHRSHRTYFGGEQCMSCGAMLGGKAASEPCMGPEPMRQQKEKYDALLACLYDDPLSNTVKVDQDRFRAAFMKGVRL